MAKFTPGPMPTTDDLALLAVTHKQLLDQLDWSESELARRADLSSVTVNQWLKNKRRLRAVHIARITGVLLKAIQGKIEAEEKQLEERKVAFKNARGKLPAFQANAPLIAAAPELYEVLSALVHDWWCPTCKEALDESRVTNSECCDTCGTYLAGITAPEWLKAARACLAKADGHE